MTDRHLQRGLARHFLLVGSRGIPPHGARQFVLGVVPTFALISIVFTCITAIVEAAGIAVAAAVAIVALPGELTFAMFRGALMLGLLRVFSQVAHWLPNAMSG